jgi:hypothetical protein
MGFDVRDSPCGKLTHPILFGNFLVEMCCGPYRDRLLSRHVPAKAEEKKAVVSPAELASGDTPAARAAISAANAQQGLAEQLA